MFSTGCISVEHYLKLALSPSLVVTELTQNQILFFNIIYNNGFMK